MRAKRRAHDVVFYLPWIGALLQGDGQPPGGAETQVFLIAKELSSRGVSVALIAYQTEQGLPSEIDGITVLPRSTWMGKRRLVGKLLEFVTAWRALLAANGSVYVQRAAGIDTGIVGLAARVLRRRFIYSSANVVDFRYETLETKARNVRLFHLGVKLADEVVVQTQEQVDLCVGRFGRTPRLIKSVAEPVAVEVAEPASLLWIGRLAPYKNPLDFVRLAQSLGDVPCRMIAVQTGRWADELAAELHEAARQAPNLEVLPGRPRAELGKEIQRAAAVVNTAEYEGMPNIFLEAWSRGIPALALHHDPDGVIERHGIGRFAAGSRERFAEMARELWERRGEAEIAARCRRYVEEEHSLERIVDSWMDVLQIPPAIRQPERTPASVGAA